MTVFYCPHCNNRIEVDDSFAGRDGWCRRCKNIITVPPRGQHGVDSVSSAENYERLAKAFQHAATKADRYQGLFLKTAEEKEHLAAELQELAGLKERFDALELAFETLRQDREQPHEPGAAPELDAVRQDVAALAAELERDRAARAIDSVKTDMPLDVGNEIRPFVERLAAHEDAALEQGNLTAAAIERLRDDVEDQHRNAAASAERLDALSSRLDALHADCDALRAERDTLSADSRSARDALEMLRAEHTELRAYCEGLRAEQQESHAEREALRAELDALRTRVEASMESELAARVAALESTVAESLEAAAARSGVCEADVATLKGEVCALAVSSTRLDELGARADALETTIAEAASQAGAMMNSGDALKESLERLSESLEGVRSDVAASRQALEEVALAAAGTHRTLEEEQAARERLGEAQSHLQTLFGALASEVQSLRASVDALSAFEAVPPDGASDEESFEGVIVEEGGPDDEGPVKPEVIDDESDTAKQMMLNSFLRFMHSQSRGKQ